MLEPDMKRFQWAPSKYAGDLLLWVSECPSSDRKLNYPTLQERHAHNFRKIMTCLPSNRHVNDIKDGFHKNKCKIPPTSTDMAKIIITASNVTSVVFQQKLDNEVVTHDKDVSR